jgi:hypothetical protein
MKKVATCVLQDLRERLRRGCIATLALLTAFIGYMLTQVSLSGLAEVSSRFGPGPDFGNVFLAVWVLYFLACSAFIMAGMAVAGVGGLLYAILGSTRRP